MRRGVAVAAGDRHPRLRQAELGTDDVDDALRAAVDMSNSRTPASRQLRSSADEHVLGHHVEERPPLIARRDDVIDGRDRALGKRTFQPRARSMSNACGVVTSWIRCSPMNSCVCPFGSRRTVCASQTFWRSVEGMACRDGTHGSRLATGDSGLGGFGDSRLGVRAQMRRSGFGARGPTRAGRDLSVGSTIAQRSSSRLTAGLAWLQQFLANLGVIRAAQKGDMPYEPRSCSFRDLDAWKAAMDLVWPHTMSRVSFQQLNASSSRRRCAGPPCRFRRISRRSSTGPGGRYRHHVRIALGSLAELETQLELVARQMDLRRRPE